MMFKTMRCIFRSFLYLCLCAATAALIVSSEAKIIPDSDHTVRKNLLEETQQAVTEISQTINAEIFNLPKVYLLPMDLSGGPEPNPACYTENSYEDETISVKCWRERIPLEEKTVTANFAEVVIAHPTQLRMAFAGGKYGLTKRLSATKLAAKNNAIIAVNADFYNCRTTGLIIRQGVLYRHECWGLDSLVIDKDGDFHVMNDWKAFRSDMKKNNEIYQCVNFGPILVEDGKAVIKYDHFHSVSGTEPYDEPRTAAGQIGRLHYLLCTVDGRTKDSPGVSTNELAVIMAERGCQVAYNFDGGQSTAMVFHNQLFNVVSNGGERSMSDIFYFSSGIPADEWQ